MTIGEKLLAAICLTPNHPAGILMHPMMLTALFDEPNGYHRITVKGDDIRFCGVPIHCSARYSATGFALCGLRPDVIVWRSDDWRDPLPAVVDIERTGRTVDLHGVNSVEKVARLAKHYHEGRFLVDALAIINEPQPCRYCGDDKRTGLPSNACENCMNTGIEQP